MSACEYESTHNWGLGKSVFYFLSLWEMTDLDLALEKEAEGRRHDRRCMIAIKKSGLCTPDASDQEL